MSFEAAKQYLARVLHWPDANEEPAFANIHWTFKKQGEDRALWTGRAVRSVKDAVSAIDFALKGADTQDVYLCMSTQRQANEKVSQKGFKYLTPIRNQGNAVKLKALFIDIDLKGGECGYNTPAEAGAALNAFLQASGMPKPTMIVASGGGFHVYWTLVRALTPAEWQPLAFALAEATKKHGLKCDTQCTVDCARVLRVPDTFNRKQAQPRAVQMLGTPLDFDYLNERIEKVLEPYKNPALTPSHLPARTPIANINSDLSAGVEVHSVGPINVLEVAKQCPFVLEALKTRGAGYTNPIWNLTTLLATFMENGRQVAHVMAQGHPGYSQSSTDNLFDRKEREKAQKNLGWPSCATISASGCKLCQTCPNFAKGKSPLNFGKPAPTPTLAPVQADQSDMPKGYKRLSDGRIVRTTVNPEGVTEEVLVSNYPMRDAQLENNMGKLILHFMTEKKPGHMQKISIPCGSIHGTDGRRILQDQGFMVPPDARGLNAFMLSWVEKLQETREAINLISFGWSLDKKAQLEGFVYGDKLWTPSGSKTAATKTSRISHHYAPKGELHFWTDAAKIITDQKRPQLDAMLCASFAAPLVRFSGHRGLIISAFSQMSGKGKTTTMDVAQAVWGHPRHKLGLTDTGNRAGGVMADLHSLPLMWDELKEEPQYRAIMGLIYQVCDMGREKGRMNSDSSFRDTGEFRSLMMVCSNNSLLEWADKHNKMTDATFLRIFEIEVTDPLPGSPGQLDPSFVQRTVGELNDHYGNMGLEYAKWLGANHARIKGEVGDFITELNKRVNVANEERFWTSTMGVLLMAAKYMKENGWADVDEAALDAFLVQNLDDLRTARAARPGDIKIELNAVELMEQYLSSQRAKNTLYTNRINQGRGAPQAGTIQVKNPNINRLEEIHVQVGLDDKVVRIHCGHLREWLAEQGYGPNKTLKALEEQFGVKDVIGRLGSGTIYSTQSIKLKEIDLAGTGVALDFIDV